MMLALRTLREGKIEQDQKKDEVVGCNTWEVLVACSNRQHTKTGSPVGIGGEGRDAWVIDGRADTRHSNLFNLTLAPPRLSDKVQPMKPTKPLRSRGF